MTHQHYFILDRKVTNYIWRNIRQPSSLFEINGLLNLIPAKFHKIVTEIQFSLQDKKGETFIHSILQNNDI